jgi:hypothetical protein
MTNISKHVGREPMDQGRELTSDELEQVSGGSQAQSHYTKQKTADGTAGGNVAAKWNLAQGAAA